MSLPSLLLRSLAPFCLAPIVAYGCASPVGSDDLGEEPVVESESEISAASAQLVGSYIARFLRTGNFVRLDLKPDGKYTAQLDYAIASACASPPCYLGDSGTWSVSRTASGRRLRVTPVGQPARIYEIKQSGTILELARSGVPQLLAKLAKNACYDNSDCKANEACGPKVCLMVCEVDDPACCAPSYCAPKTP